MRENPVVRIHRRWLEVFIEEWQRWIRETLSDLVNPQMMEEYLKKMGIDPTSLPGMVPPQSGFDAYQILGLHRSASDDEVRKRYHELLHRLHPDKSGTPGTGFLLQMVLAAFETIKRERGWT